MKFIEPKVEILEQGPGLEGMYKAIEAAGRNCYQSSHLIGEGTAKPFVDRMIESKHYAMLEHGTVYLCAVDWDSNPLRHYWSNQYSKCHSECLEIEHCQSDTSHKYAYYVTTNLRVLVENGWLDDLKYFCEPTEHHKRRVTARFYTQIAITREFNRHRVNSIAEESTRYCNYSKEKYGNEIAINVPTWIDIPNELPTFEDLVRGIEFGDHHKEWGALDWWLMANVFCEKAYLELTELGWPAQQARTILPLDTNTTLVHTAFVSDWDHFFDLRSRGTTGKPHPDAQFLAVQLEQMFIERGYIIKPE